MWPNTRLSMHEQNQKPETALRLEVCFFRSSILNLHFAVCYLQFFFLAQLAYCPPL
jgi:hypothetical protein